MRTSTILIAVAVAFASALIAWATMPARPGVAPTTEPTETFALAFDTPSVNALTVTSAGQTATLTRDGPGWTLTLPTIDRSGTGNTTWPANPDAVRVLINELATQSIEAATGSESSPASADPLATLTIDLPGGSTSIAVTAPPIAGRLPVRITMPDGTDRAGFVRADRFRPTDVGQLAALADPKPFNSGGVITRIAVTPRDGAGFAIHRVGGIWQIDEDSPEVGAGSERLPRLHQPTIRAILDDLAAIRAASVIVPIDSGSDAFDDPFLAIETTADRPRTAGEPRMRTTASLTVAAEPTVDGLTDAMATRAADDHSHTLQVRLDPRSFPPLPADLGTLLDPVPLPWEASDTAEILITDDTGELRLDFRRTLDGWSRMNPGTEPIKPHESDALRSLASVLATGWQTVERSTATDESDAWVLVRLRPVSTGSESWLRVSADESSLRVAGSQAVWTLVRSPDNRAAAQFIDALNTLVNIDPVRP